MGACRLPFVPDLFSARALATVQERQLLDELVAAPYFDDLMAGEPAHRPPVPCGPRVGGLAYGAAKYASRYETEGLARCRRRRVPAPRGCARVPSSRSMKAAPMATPDMPGTVSTMRQCICGMGRAALRDHPEWVMSVDPSTAILIGVRPVSGDQGRFLLRRVCC
jgi:hypothetical protein